MKIPVQNLYYILCYALSDYFVAGPKDVSGSKSDHPLDLLCGILVHEADSLVKRGLHQAYVPTTSCDGSLRGRLDFQASLKSGSLAKRRLFCQHDEMNADSSLNQTIKSTLALIAQMESIDQDIRSTAGQIALRFSSVRRVPLSKANFSVRLDSSLKRYALAIGICRFIYESILIDDEGSERFVDFHRDEVAMRAIFESFVRNLLRHKLVAPYAVSRRRYPFASLTGEKQVLALVPTMSTDVVVEGPSSTLVIEVKYVPGSTAMYRGVQRFRSAHLYQLLSYVRNFPHPKDRASGLLIYPAVNVSSRDYFSTRDAFVGVSELDLSKDWMSIESQLLGSVLSMISASESDRAPAAVA